MKEGSNGWTRAERDLAAALPSATGSRTSACVEPLDLMELIEQGSEHPSAAGLMSHVAGCPYCRRQYAEVRQTLQLAADTRRSRAAPAIAPVTARVSRRAWRIWLPAAGFAAAVVLALVFVLHHTPRRGAPIPAGIDTLVAEAARGGKWAALMPYVSEERGGETQGWPDDVAFLPGDTILIRADPGGLPGPWNLSVGGRTVRENVAAPNALAPAPPRGWPAGPTRWRWTNRAGDPLEGDFYILSRAEAQTVADGERQLANYPPLLIAFYYQHGLVTHALEALARVRDSGVRKRLRQAIPYSPPEGP